MSRSRVEDGIQRQVIKLCRTYAGQIPALGLVFHIPNGGYRSPKEAAILQGLGVLSGVPDLCLPVECEHSPANMLFVEMKKPGGTLSDAQEMIIPRLRAAGNSVQVCVSVESAWANLLWHIRPQGIEPPRSDRFAGHPAADVVERIRREVEATRDTIDRALKSLNYRSPRAYVRPGGRSVYSIREELLHFGPSAAAFAEFINRGSLDHPR